MSLHLKKSTTNCTNKTSNNDDLYNSSIALKPLSKYQIPQNESNSKTVYQLIKDELMLDGNSRQNLATFCQTFAEDEIHKLMEDCLDKNMIDKDEYPQTAEIESRCVNMIADLWNGKPSQAIGTSTTGSSEACMLGGIAMKWRWQKKMNVCNKTTEDSITNKNNSDNKLNKTISHNNNSKNSFEKPNLVCGPVQICWHKFARYWDVELREIPMSENQYVSTVEEVIKRCDKNTIGVVLTLGTTFTGQYEPIKEINDALDNLQKEKGLDIYIHVDAASGGFLAPFTNPKLLWDFRLPRVKSISTSGHKFGLTPLGCGWIIWQDKKDLPEELIFNVNYLGGNMPTFAINFSRPGGQIVCQYYNLLRLGKDGYTKIQQDCYNVGKDFAKKLKSLNIFELIYDSNPETGIPAVTWKLKNNEQFKGQNINFNLYDLSDVLRQRGWLVPAYTLPNNCNDIIVQRVIIRHGCSFDLMELLIEDIERSIVYLQQRTNTHNAESSYCSRGSFNHS